MKLTPGIVVAERFRLVRELGEGGMGSVWLAHHEKLEMPCAVKFIHADVAEAAGMRERFEREAKIAGQLKSPNVVQVLDYGLSGDMPYIAMEFLEGEDLARRLEVRGRLSAHETVTIVAQIARALTKAHAAGLVHRDLKPENVFIVKDDDHEIVKVLDFGIAKVKSPIDSKTKTGALMGTPRYMSPEQAQGQRDLDHRSDLWSLGVIGYRAIVGALPFDSDAIGDLMMRIIVHPIPVPSQVLPGIPASFDAWWARASARDPAQRFQSAKELSEALAYACGFGVAQAPAASAVTPMQTSDPNRYPSSPNSPSQGGSSAARAYTPASSQPIPAAMIGAPTVLPDGRARSSVQPGPMPSSQPPIASGGTPPPTYTPQPNYTPQPGYAPQAIPGQQVTAQTRSGVAYLQCAAQKADFDGADRGRDPRAGFRRCGRRVRDSDDDQRLVSERSGASDWRRGRAAAAADARAAPEGASCAGDDRLGGSFGEHQRRRPARGADPRSAAAGRASEDWNAAAPATNAGAGAKRQSSY